MSTLELLNSFVEAAISVAFMLLLFYLVRVFQEVERKERR